jgi:predicted MPP superfamily phosphohydrolase
MVRLVFAVVVCLALLGDARIFLFIMNRFVFGDHREEHHPWGFLMWTTPPILLVLTALFWPLNNWIERLLSTHVVERITPERMEEVVWSIALAKVGGAWLMIAACVGLYWIVDRFRELTMRRAPLEGVVDREPRLVALRRAHVPFGWIRRLGAHNDVYDIEVTSHDLFVDELAPEFDGYRIAFLTDTHVAPFIRPPFYRAVVTEALRFQPDLILLGGDFVTWNRHIALMTSVLLTDLRAPDGVFAVLGNHDYWSKGDEVRAAMEAKGVRFIINENVRIRRNASQIALLGIDELYRGTPNLENAFAGIGADEVTIGVSHHPDIIDLIDAEGRRLDLLVCGHTHGGQIRFPFFGPVVVPSKHEGLYAEGFHRMRNVLMYVSRGIGAIPPLRILCRPEVATFTLRRGGRAI